MKRPVDYPGFAAKQYIVVEKELIINSSPTQVEIALLEDSKLVELHTQKTNSNFTVGDIFVGKIRKLMPGLNAAFVDIGHKKDAFLHYTDLGPKFNSLTAYTRQAMRNESMSSDLGKFRILPDIKKTGKVTQVFDKREPILVQILKEPISTKGPRLSCELTIPGRFVVLTPFNNVVAVSKKLSNAEERKRLQRLVESIKPPNFGVIVRTASEGKKVADLYEEIKSLLDKWQEVKKQLYKAQAPKKILKELDKTQSVMRDLLSDSFNKIVVNDRQMYQEVKTFLGEIYPDKVKIVSQHNSRKHIFDAYGINRQIKSSFGKTATLPSGAYVVIEHTEAMHVIDVNSGHKVANASQSQAALNVNLEVAKEIARQLRLRDIGGIIIIDFIDMKIADHRRILASAMRDLMNSDRAQHTILPLSKFGLMQITRQRVRPEVKINTDEKCPTCNGKGKIAPSILLLDEINRDLEFVQQSRPKSGIQLRVHPYVEAYLKSGVVSQRAKWFLSHGKWIKVHADMDLGLTEYEFYDSSGDQIRLN